MGPSVSEILVRHCSFPNFFLLFSSSNFVSPDFYNLLSLSKRKARFFCSSPPFIVGCLLTSSVDSLPRHFYPANLVENMILFFYITVHLSNKSPYHFWYIMWSVVFGIGLATWPIVPF